MNNQFGLIVNDSPLDMSVEQIRATLTRHGVVCFRGLDLSDPQLMEVMQKFGEAQHFVEQRAPFSDADKNNPRIINLHNNDFLGKTRMGWHMDQTFLKRPYLPVRSLYCYFIEGNNITEFADIKYLTDRVLGDWPELGIDLNAEYIDGLSKSIRPIFSYCNHVNRLLLRYDSRMFFKDHTVTKAFKEYCENILNGEEIPKLSIKWEVGDLVIFDNNQAPHRRGEMGGDCKLKRITSNFWLD